MTKPVTRRRTQPPLCELCYEPVETAATAQNPSATITANSLARCSSCNVLFVIGADLQTSHDLSNDEAAFNAAMNASPEIKEWAVKTLGNKRTSRDLRRSDKAECVIKRVLSGQLVERGAPDLVDDLATLDAYVAGFDEKGITSATPAIRFRASSILGQMRRQTRH